MTSILVGQSVYPINERDFTQVYCPDQAYVRMNINQFATELDKDILFIGTGFPTATLQELENITMQARSGNVVSAVPAMVEVLSGVLGNNDPLEFATDAVWFYFTSDDVYSSLGYDISVECGK